MKEILFRLARVHAPIRLVNCAGVLDRLPLYMPGWPAVEVQTGELGFAGNGETPAATLVHNGEMFRISSPRREGARFHKTEVNAVCDLISALAYARIHSNEDLLSLHAGAVRINGQLALFPGVAKAGKSTLSAVLSQYGAEVFTDDVLPLVVQPGAPIFGLATGIAPRLRLPLPDNIDVAFREFLAASGGPENSQYKYLPSQWIAPQGETAPVGAIILLERIDNTQEPTLEPASRGDVLRVLLKQNFSREGDSGMTLAALHGLASMRPCYRLRYYAPQDAARLLMDHFNALPAPDMATYPKGGPALQGVPAEPAEPIKIEENQTYGHASHCAEFELEGTFFLASSDRQRILHIDEGARRIWHLLRQPASPNEAIEILTAAFPDADAAQIRADTREIFTRFSERGVIAPVGNSG